MFREFAITLSAAVAISMVVSLTTTPDDVRQAAQSHQKGRKAQSASIAPASADFSALYEALRQQPAMGPANTSAWSSELPLGTVCLAVYLYIVVPKGFFPAAGYRPLERQRHRSTRTFLSSPCRQKLDPVRRHHPERSGRGYRGRLYRWPGNTAGLNITLKPLSQRKVSADQVVNRLRPKLARVPGATSVLAGGAATCKSAAA